MSDKDLGPGTILARGGRGFRTDTAASGSRIPRPEPLTEPLSLSSVYRFESLEQVDEVWEGRSPGHVYRRFGNPNTAALERVVAALEGAEAAVACASGMGALLAALSPLVAAGEAVVAQRGLYGGTQTLLEQHLTRLGIGTVLSAEPTPAAFAAALGGQSGAGRPARAFLVESIANPSLKIADLPGLASLARERGATLVVDNTFATPLACRPLRFGPGLVVHSVTKYLNGHSDVIGGVVAGPAEKVEPVRKAAIALGLTMSPLDAWLTLRGLKTLHLRYARQQENAAAIARHLEGRPGVARVLYPGLASHPDNQLARKVLTGFGAMVSFELEGGAPAVERFVSRLRLVSFAPSLGETETTVMYPARTSHRSLSAEDKLAAGAGPGLVRLSTGVEEVQDIIGDLDQALAG